MAGGICGGGVSPTGAEGFLQLAGKKVSLSVAVGAAEDLGLGAVIGAFNAGVGFATLNEILLAVEAVAETFAEIEGEGWSIDHIYVAIIGTMACGIKINRYSGAVNGEDVVADGKQFLSYRGLASVIPCLRNLEFVAVGRTDDLADAGGLVIGADQGAVMHMIMATKAVTDAVIGACANKCVSGGSV